MLPGGERHCESKVSCPRQHDDPGQRSNPDRSIRSPTRYPLFAYWRRYFESTGQFGGEMSELDDAGTYFDLGPKKVTGSGTYHYMSTRNNNFSNRSQKGRITISNTERLTRKIGRNGGTLAFNEWVPNQYRSQIPRYPYPSGGTGNEILVPPWQDSWILAHVLAERYLVARLVGTKLDADMRFYSALGARAHLKCRGYWGREPGTKEGGRREGPR